MKTLIRLLGLSLILGCPLSSMAQPFQVMTYNIRYDNPKDGENRWDNRKAQLVKQIESHQPAILGIQEGLMHQVEYLAKHLEGYSWVGVGRDDGKEKGEFSAIFFKQDRFSKVDDGTFWLSKTPDTISIGWDAALERICTWVQLKDKEKEDVFWVLNTHFDHRGEQARINSAKLILEKVSSFQNESKDPLILMGDLNVPPESEVIRNLTTQLKDTFQQANKHSGPEGTWNGFSPKEDPGDRIDYILTSSSLKVISYETLAPIVDRRYLSDHFPVLVELKRRAD